jgi:hypothetical protein
VGGAPASRQGKGEEGGKIAVIEPALDDVWPERADEQDQPPQTVGIGKKRAEAEFFDRYARSAQPLRICTPGFETNDLVRDARHGARGNQRGQHALRAPEAEAADDVQDR